MNLSVEVRSSGEKSGSTWLNKDGKPSQLVSTLARTVQALRPRDGVAIVIRRES